MPVRGAVIFVIIADCVGTALWTGYWLRVGDSAAAGIIVGSFVIVVSSASAGIIVCAFVFVSFVVVTS